MTAFLLRSDPPPLTADDRTALAQIARIAAEKAGLAFLPEKFPMLRARLGKRLRHLHLSDLTSYCRFLDGPGGLAEQDRLIGLLTTHVSHFFREPHHFDRLAQEILAPLLDAAKRGKRVRLWSAGCAAGQEAWTLAMLILDALPTAADHDILILGTDIGASLLTHAERRFYPASCAAAIPEPYRARFVRNQDQGIELSKDLAPLVRFRSQNLHAPWRMRAPFDVIMCRNVLIYFDQPNCERLLDRFGRALAPGGFLMLGHSERMSGPALKQLEPSGIATWRLPLMGEGARR